MKTFVLITLVFCMLAGTASAQCTPSISNAGCNLETASKWEYVSFQWFRNGVALPNAVYWNYEPLKAGSYYVQTTTATGCIGFSQRIKIVSWCGVGGIN
jgi:hypothetical protein